ncbi:MAG: SRPBCC domain-containing protein [Anaerolineae bacterium]|nr:SRPBCC domain-containing protein [Anaerolineae bacterium]
MKITTSRVVIDAPASRVWNALTQAALVKQWQYGADLTTDWNVGSPIEFCNEWNGELFVQSGVVLEVDEPLLLRYSLFAPRPGLENRPENRFVMTYRLEEHAGSTDLTIVQEDPREQADVDETSDENGNPVLQALKDLVEKG